MSTDQDMIKLGKNQNIFLIGPVGAGKTTIGKILARELNRKFYDSDHEIEERTGADIAWIFDIEGEDGFRNREVQLIDELSQLQGIVLSTGGGVVLRPENRKALSARGLVIYLSVSIEQQLARTAKDSKRPLLRTDDKEGMLKKMCEERNSLYQEIADVTFPTDEQTPQGVAKRILNSIVS